MVAKHRVWQLMLALVLLTPGLTFAGPECEGQGAGSAACPRSDYSILHYWAPSLFQARAQLHNASRLDQYPPGPSPSVSPSYEFNRYKCPSIPPTPSSPYADPAGYFGRTVTPR